MEPRLEHDPSFASDSPHNGIWCVVLALIGVLTLPHVRSATCKASIQRILTGQQLSMLLQAAYKYKTLRCTRCPYIKLPLKDQRRPRPLDRIGKNLFIGGAG